MVEENLYKILNLKQFSSSKEIRKAFIKKALESHPHRTGFNSEEVFIRIKNAYDKLSDSTFKLNYDKTLLQESKKYESNEKYKNSNITRNNSNDERIFETKKEYFNINNENINGVFRDKNVDKYKEEYDDFNLKINGKNCKEKKFKSNINLENLVKIYCKSGDLNLLKFKCKRFGKIKRFIVKESFVFIEFRNLDSLKLFMETEKNNFLIRRLFYFDEELYKTESELFDKLKNLENI
ncbi:hypothetical protein LUQ84_002187 [Hamiltosporidium tvaerminnensis]|nr:hypothetical protein LUQ84_002187 [Hamiltosporidium tvaerminnensis]